MFCILSILLLLVNHRFLLSESNLCVSQTANGLQEKENTKQARYFDSEELEENSKEDFLAQTLDPETLSQEVHWCPWHMWKNTRTSTHTFNLASRRTPVRHYPFRHSCPIVPEKIQSSSVSSAVPMINVWIQLEDQKLTEDQGASRNHSGYGSEVPC